MVSAFILFPLALCHLLPEVPAAYYPNYYYVPRKAAPPPPPPLTELQESIIHYDTNPDSIRQPIRDLAKITKLIEAKQPKELKDHLSKASCENKIQYRENIVYRDSVDLIHVKHSGMISLALVSMIGCPVAQVHAARLKIFAYPTTDYSSKRLRDFTEVLVTVSETGQMHDDFIKFYGEDVLKRTFESKRHLGLKDDVENVCFELIERRRADPSLTKIDAKEAAEKLKHEKNKWDDKREEMDYYLMETPLEQVPAILDEYKSLTNQSLEDAFNDEFGNDVFKPTAYKQLVGLGRDKIAYLADEINARQNVESDFIERSFPVANTITMLAVLCKEDRKKVEDEYQKKFSINLLEELDRMLPTLDFGEVVTEVLKMYVEDMKKN